VKGGKNKSGKSIRPKGGETKKEVAFWQLRAGWVRFSGKKWWENEGSGGRKREVKTA